MRRGEHAKGEAQIMIELVRTNDPVFISWLMAHLEGAGVEAFMLDEHASVMDGSVLAVPRRIMVADDHVSAAQEILAEARRIAAQPADDLDDA